MNKLDILYLVKEFYAIEALDALLVCGVPNPLKNCIFEPFRHSHARWKEDFDDFRERFNTALAAAVYDFTVLAVAGELRHGYCRASEYIHGYYNEYAMREDVYHQCTVFRDKDILEAGVRLFDIKRVEWPRGYGGEKWQTIAKAGMMKGQISDRLFIDYCVDLSHNGNLYFDKGAGIFLLIDVGSYYQFLDMKRNCMPYTLLEAQHGREFNKLLCRANTLNIIDYRARAAPDLFYRVLAESLVLDYQPIQWGTKKLDITEENIRINKYYSRSRTRSESRSEWVRESAKRTMLVLPAAA